MNNLTAYKKKICMSELTVAHSALDTDRFLDASAGNTDCRFVFIERGAVTVSTGQSRLCFKSGDLFYIPEATQYTAIWEGNAGIEYYCIMAKSSSPDSSLAASGFALQRLDELSKAEYGDAIKNIFSLLGSDDKVNKLRAISLYYGFYATAYPQLKAAQNVSFGPMLTKAIRYIEDNYVEDFSISDLALHCFVSESRIHHLFTEKLGTTPIKYRNNVRVEHAAHQLRSTDLPLDTIAAINGFNSSSYFRETFKSVMGLTPSEYRRLFSKEARSV